MCTLLIFFRAMNTVVNNVAIEEPMEEEWTYDPNEPRYCICNQVSYGDMVACDNQDVSSRVNYSFFFPNSNTVLWSILIEHLFSASNVTHLNTLLNLSFSFAFQCPYEWFHYPCVGITAPPKGKWYCPQCQTNMRRNRAHRKNWTLYERRCYCFVLNLVSLLCH